MVVGGRARDLVIGDDVVSSSQSFKYLDVTLSAEGKSEQDINNKIVLSEKEIRLLNPVL